MAVLKQLKGIHPAIVTALKGELTVLGRHPDCHVRIDTPAVSRHHAQLLNIDGRYFLQDQSRNGTCLNGEFVQEPQELHDNDRIDICGCVFSFHLDPPSDNDPHVAADSLQSASSAADRSRAMARTIPEVIWRQDQTADNELERCVEERTAEVCAANDQLRLNVEELKHVEVVLRESEERYRRLAELMPTAMYACDAEGRITYFNEHAATAWGRKPKIGDTDERFCGSFRIYQPDGSLLSPDKSPMSVALNVGRAFHNQEVTIERPDGSRVTVLVNIEPIYDASGTISGAINVFFDITELRQAQVALQESEAKFRVLSERSPAIVMIARLDRVVYCNPMAATVTGYSIDELLEMNLLDMIHADHRKLVADRHRQRLAGKTVPPQYEIKIVTKRGESRWLDISIEVIDYEGSPAVLVICVDATVRVRAEKEARQHQEKLAHVTRLSAMGEMTTGLAHELNQPLAAISNYCYAGRQALADTESVDPKQLRELFETLTEQAVRAGEIIRRLRRFVDRKPPVHARVDIVEPIQDVLHLLDFDLRQHEVRVEQLTDDSGHVTIIDAIQIQQVLVNLVRNALDAMHETERDLRTIEITTSATGDVMIEVAVRDTGRGIPIESADQVFDAFFSTKSDSMGMGLAISRTIIESHGGRLWMTPNRDRGVTFHFTVPMAAEGSDVDGR